MPNYVVIAENVADLHGDNAKWTKETVLNENGEPVNGRGDDRNRHDILTGSQRGGTAFPGDDTTCSGWTSIGEGSARVGHHDRIGGGEFPRRGTRRTDRADAASRTSGARAATACSTASP